MASSPITSWPIDGGKVETVADFIFLVSKITVDSDCNHEIKKKKKRKKRKPLFSWKKTYDKPIQCVKVQRYHFVNKCLYSESYDFSMSYLQM